MARATIVDYVLRGHYGQEKEVRVTCKEYPYSAPYMSEYMYRKALKEAGLCEGDYLEGHPVFGPWPHINVFRGQKCVHVVPGTQQSSAELAAEYGVEVSHD